ncbi:Aspartate racemase, partial [Globisporangium splendens]
MTREQQVMLGICGGVGPAAGVLLHQIILEHTESDGEDQGHFNVCHFSRSEDMTDRTEYLQHVTQAQKDDAGDGSLRDTSTWVENPACGMARTFEMMKCAAQSQNVRLVAGVPCNTFHANPIWNEFLRLTTTTPTMRSDYDHQHVHMLEETVRFIAKYAPSCKRIGLMATTGTRDSRVYHDLMEPLGYTIIEICPSLQTELHESIYNKVWGIKSTAPAVTSKSVANFHRYARYLKDQGAEVIVMGCTEIPFAFTGRKTFAGLLLIDPLVALARAMIREADSARLKPLALDGGACVTPIVKLSQPRLPTEYSKSRRCS